MNRYLALTLWVSLACAFCLPVLAVTDIASTGNWNAASTWQSNTTPASGDTLVVPFGVTVTVNCNCGTYNNMHIVVHGTLHFPGGRKINLSSNGLIDVYTGGLITGENGGSKIVINTISMWDGDDPDISGPASCGSSGCGSNPALPVGLLSFRCSDAGDFVRLDWETAVEVRNDFFTVTYSSDLENWRECGVVDGAGNTGEAVRYEFLTPKTNLGLTYYRLSQTDLDGEVKHLAVVEWSETMVVSLRVFPNPSVGETTIEIPAGAGFDRVVIYDAHGHKAFDKPVVDTGYPLLFHLSMERPGVYCVAAKKPSGENVNRILVVH